MIIREGRKDRVTPVGHPLLGGNSKFPTIRPLNQVDIYVLYIEVSGVTSCVLVIE